MKGIGQDHAKFSPVGTQWLLNFNFHILMIYSFLMQGTASYRLLPEIVITRPITGESADRFARCFPDGVIAVDNVGGNRSTHL